MYVDQLNLKTMKKVKLFGLSLLTLSAAALLTGCGGKGSDIPDYALGKGSYFGNHKSGFTAVSGKIETLPEAVSFGYDETNRMMEIKGYEVQMDGKNFYFLFKGTLGAGGSRNNRVNRLFEDNSLTVHALVAPNNNDGKYAKMKNDRSYSDSYFFVDDEELAEAMKAFDAAPKTPNQTSRYTPKEYADRGGEKTYHAEIVAVVKYRGRENFGDTEFVSLYLSCGAAVQLYTEESVYSGDKIDCITDKDNRVIKYKID
jgi:hypothetical protein